MQNYLKISFYKSAMEVGTTIQYMFTILCYCKRKGKMDTIDRKGLLLLWWHYYGKCIYTLAELEEFERIIDEYGAEKVLDAAMASYICGDGSPTTILMSIRKNKVTELFDSLPDIEKLKENEKKAYKAAKEEFVRIISPRK